MKFIVNNIIFDKQVCLFKAFFEARLWTSEMSSTCVGCIFHYGDLLGEYFCIIRCLFNY